MCERTQAPTQVPNAITKHFHKTQALMGATRPASGIKAKAHRQAYRLTDRHVISAVCEPLSVYEHCIYPDVMNRSYRTKFIKEYG